MESLDRCFENVCELDLVRGDDFSLMSYHKDTALRGIRILNPNIHRIHRRTKGSQWISHRHISEQDIQGERKPVIVKITTSTINRQLKTPDTHTFLRPPIVDLPLQGGT